MRAEQMIRGHSRTHSAAVFALWSIASPMAGVFGEITLAWRFGASDLMDAYRSISLLLNFGSAFLFAQILPHLLIPAFCELRAKNSEDAAWQFSFSMGAAIGIATSIAAGWAALNPGLTVDILGPGLSVGARAKAGQLVAPFAFALVLMTWSGVMNGVLQNYDVFIVLPLSQMLGNVLLAVVVVFSTTGNGTAYIGAAVLAGAILTAVIHLFWLLSIRRRRRLRGSIGVSRSALDRLWKWGRLGWPLVLLFIAQQWSIVAYNRAFSTLTPGTVATVGYSTKMLMLATLVPTSLATILFPGLSDAVARGDEGQAKRLFDRFLRMILFLCIPVIPLLWALRLDMVKILFGHGAMGAGDAKAIADLFALFLLSAPAFPLIGILLKLFYARHDTKTPVLVGCAAAVVAICLAPTAARLGNLRGVAMAWNLTNWLNAGGLLAAQAWMYGVVSLPNLLRHTGKLAAISGCLAAIALARSSIGPETVAPAITADAITIAASALALSLLARTQRVPEGAEVIAYLRSSFGLLASKLAASK